MAQNNGMIPVNKKKQLKSILKSNKQNKSYQLKQHVQQSIDSHSDTDSIDVSDNDNEYDALHGEQSDMSDNHSIDQNNSGDNNEDDQIDDSTTKFADAINSLLQQDTVSTIRNTLHNQSIKRRNAQLNDTEQQNEINELAQKRQLKQRRIEKRLLLSKDHLLPEYTPIERTYIKIATRGVVSLFNAISKQQKILSDAKLVLDRKTLKKNSIATKDTFLQLLSKQKDDINKKNNNTNTNTESDNDSSNEVNDSGDDQSMKSESEDGSDSGDMPIKSTKKPVKSSWSVLSDSYMLGGNKMKDWSESSSSEDDEQQDENNED